jgi:hypothetical protein
MGWKIKISHVVGPHHAGNHCQARAATLVFTLPILFRGLLSLSAGVSVIQLRRSLIACVTHEVSELPVVCDASFG